MVADRGRKELGSPWRSSRVRETPHAVLLRQWQRIMCRCWQDRTPYNEVYYLTMLQKRSSKLLKLITEPVEQTA